MSIFKISIEKYLLALILFVLILVSLNGFMGEDEGRFSYMGRVWAECDLPPYTETVENKTPGIFILNAISYALFGTNIFFVRILGIVSLLLSSLLIFKISKILHSKEAGLIGMLVFGLSISWRGMDGAFSSYTESFMVLFVLLSFYLIIIFKHNNSNFILSLLSGISMGFAIAFKQIAITSTAGLIFFLFINYTNFYKTRQLILHFCLIMIGILIGTIISIIPLLFYDVSIIDYINGSWIILFDEGSSPTLLNRFISARAIWLESRMVFFYPFLAILIVQPILLNKKYLKALLIWLLFDFIGVNASGYYFGHQIKQIMPILSILIGISIANIIIEVSNTKNKIQSINRFLLILCLLILPYNLLFENFQRIKSNKTPNPSKEIGHFLKNASKSTDYVYIMTNANALLSYTDRVSATRFFNPLFVNSAEEHEELLNDVKTKKPKFIVQRIDEKQFTFPEEYHRYINSNYRIIDEMYEYKILLYNSYY